MSNFAKRQTGATLIESLISILVLSIGLLGIAGIQVNALSYQKTAWSSQRIADIVNEVGERIRLNPQAAKDGEYQYQANYAAGSAATITGNNCRTSGAFCSTSQIASDDMSALISKAQAVLPGGALQLTGSSTSGYIVTLMYRDKDFVGATGVQLAATTCSSSSSGMDWRNCCPTSAAVPNGVRCRRSVVYP